MHCKTTTLLISSLLVVLCSPVFANDGIPTLEPVTVIGQAEDRLSGTNSIDRTQIDSLPTKDGSINEVISIVPGVQLPEQGRTSIKGGEIIPPNISISGSAVYQNNFMIDGFSNNSLLDPMNTSPTGAQFVPGHPQAVFLPVTLVEDIKVYRYNVPAAYGSFTGGVVEASTIGPSDYFWGDLSYRATRDRWTDFYIDNRDEDDFENPVDERYQPEFTKQEANLSLNFPLREGLNLLTAYNLTHSKIPINNFSGEKDQIRRNENFLGKLAWEIDSSSTLEATLQYSPYQGDYFSGLAKNSSFEIEGGGWQASLDYERDFEIGKLSLLSAVKGSRNNRDAPQNLFVGWLAYVGGVESSKPWGIEIDTDFRGVIVSREGSVGSLDSTQDSVEFKVDFLSRPIKLGQTEHQINVGINLEAVRGELDRDQEHNQYYTNRTPANNENPDIVCAPDDPACIDNEQVFLNRSHFPVGKSSADINLIDVYAEDTLAWKNLELRPGVRISYDDFMKNTNIAPRFAASYDLMGNGNTVLITGWNRYYGKTLLTYKLREASPGVDVQTRGVTCVDVAGETVCTADPWPAYDPPSTYYRYSEADTPYSDETVLGLDQGLLGGRLKLTWVNRKGRDEFARERTDRDASGQRYYQLTNNGESEHDEYTVEWERHWRDHYLAINATYQETTQSNESYLDNFYGDLYLEDLVWYEGDYIKRAELPREDFSRPWVVNLVYSARLPRGFSFTNVTKYRSGYEGLDSLNSAQKAARGLPRRQTAYIDARFPSAITFDWKIDWSIPFKNGQALTTSLEINNVFNEKVQIGDGGIVSDTAPEDYELGRQFWLGMSYTF